MGHKTECKNPVNGLLLDCVQHCACAAVIKMQSETEINLRSTKK